MKSKTQHREYHVRTEEEEEYRQNLSLYFRVNYMLNTQHVIFQGEYDSVGNLKLRQFNKFMGVSGRNLDKIEYFYGLDVDLKEDEILRKFLTNEVGYICRASNIKSNKSTKNVLSLLSSIMKLIQSKMGGRFGIDKVKDNEFRNSYMRFLKTKIVRGQLGGQPSLYVKLGEVIEKKTGVCFERTLLFKICCDILGINCKIISGAKGKSFPFGHSWNIVTVRNQKYYVDLNFFTKPRGEPTKATIVRVWLKRYLVVKGNLISTYDSGFFIEDGKEYNVMNEKEYWKSFDLEFDNSSVMRDIRSAQQLPARSEQRRQLNSRNIPQGTGIDSQSRQEEMLKKEVEKAKEQLNNIVGGLKSLFFK